MFNSFAIKRLEKKIHFVSKLKCYPLIWDSSSNLIYPGESSRKKFISVCSLILLYLIYLLIQLGIGLLLSALKFAQIMWIALFVLGFVISSITITSLHLKKNEISTLLRHFVFLQEKISGRKHAQKFMHRLIQFLIFCDFLQEYARVMA